MMMKRESEVNSVVCFGLMNLLRKRNRGNHQSCEHFLGNLDLFPLVNAMATNSQFEICINSMPMQSLLRIAMDGTAFGFGRDQTAGRKPINTQMNKKVPH
jgi:hypothetical protein